MYSANSLLGVQALKSVVYTREILGKVSRLAR